MLRSVSRMPSRQPRPSAATLAIARLARSRSTISGSAKMPRPTTTIGSPSVR